MMGGGYGVVLVGMGFIARVSCLWCDFVGSWGFGLGDVGCLV